MVRWLPLALLLAGCAGQHLPPCSASIAIKPDVQSGLRLPPDEIVGTVSCKLER